MDKSIPEAGLLIVKKDDIIVDDETGETYLVARGTYEVNEDGSCFLNIHKNNN